LILLLIRETILSKKDMSVIIELGAIVLVSYLADKWLSVKGKEDKELEKV